jgi:hypothetical protein
MPQLDVLIEKSKKKSFKKKKYCFWNPNGDDIDSKKYDLDINKNESTKESFKKKKYRPWNPSGDDIDSKKR